MSETAASGASATGTTPTTAPATTAAPTNGNGSPPPSGSPQSTAGAPAAPAPKPPANDNGAATGSTGEAPQVGSDPSVQELLDLKAMGEKFVEVTIDGEPKRMKLSEALGLARKARASDERFEEAARVRKEADDALGKIERFYGALEQDTESVLERLLGDKLDQIAEARLARRAKIEAMTPEERRAYDLDQRQRQLDAEATRIEAEKKKTEGEARERWVSEKAVQARAALAGEFTKALTAAELPDTRTMQRLLAGLARDWIAEGKQLTREAVAQLAGVLREEFDGLRGDALTRDRARLAGLEGDALLDEFSKAYGEDVFGKVRKADLDRLKRQQQAQTQPRTHTGQFTTGAKQPPAGTQMRKSLEQVMAEREAARSEAARRRPS